MIATHKLSVFNHDVEIADDIVKRIDSKAKYMCKYDFATELFIPSLDGQYLIDGESYDTLWTNKYDELLKSKKKIKYEQIKLF